MIQKQNANNVNPNSLTIHQRQNIALNYVTITITYPIQITHIIAQLIHHVQVIIHMYMKLKRNAVMNAHYQKFIMNITVLITVLKIQYQMNMVNALQQINVNLEKVNQLYF